MEFFRSRKLAKAFENVSKNRDRLASDLLLAEELQRGGCEKNEVYIGNRHLIALELNTSTQRAFTLGPLLRRSNIFQRDALRRQVSLTASYRKFCSQHKITSVYQLILRPKEYCADWEKFREFHRNQCARMVRSLQYAVKICPGLDIDIVSSELGPVAASVGKVDIHFHILFHFQRNRDIRKCLARFVAYLRKGWLLPRDAEIQAMKPRNPGASAHYVSKGLPYVARQMRDAWDDSNSANKKITTTHLVTLFRQTRRLALARARGRFRRWLSSQKPTPVRSAARRSNKFVRHPGSRPPQPARPLVLGVSWVPSPEGRMVHAVLALCPPGAEEALKAHLYYSHRVSLYPRDPFEVELINRVNFFYGCARRDDD